MYPCDYVWTWSCIPVPKASSEYEACAGPKSLSAESKPSGEESNEGTADFSCPSETGLTSPERPTDYLLLELCSGSGSLETRDSRVP